MASIPDSLLHTAQFVGLSTSLLLSGLNMGASHVAVPLLHRLDNDRYNPKRHHHHHGRHCFQGRGKKNGDKDESDAAPPSYSYTDADISIGIDSKSGATAQTIDVKGDDDNNHSGHESPAPSPPVSSPQAIAHLYSRAARRSAPIAVLSALASAFAAYASPAGGQARTAWAVAAAVVLASLPFAVALAREARKYVPGRWHRCGKGRRGGGRRWGRKGGSRRFGRRGGFATVARDEAEAEKAVEEVEEENAGDEETRALLLQQQQQRTAAAADFGSDEDTLRTLRRWRMLNMACTKLVLVGGLVGAWAVVFAA